MAKFVCTGCGYRFEADKEKVKKCPYCAEDKLEQEKSASELIDTVSVD